MQCSPMKPILIQLQRPDQKAVWWLVKVVPATFILETSLNVMFKQFHHQRKASASFVPLSDVCYFLSIGSSGWEVQLKFNQQVPLEKQDSLEVYIDGQKESFSSRGNYYTVNLPRTIAVIVANSLENVVSSAFCTCCLTLARFL